MRTLRKRVFILVAALAPAVLAAGCGGGGGAEGPRIVSFATAERAGSAATIEGIPDVSSLKQNTGQPTEFTLREEASARKLRVVAPVDVPVPANLPSASYVVVTGSYDPASRVFHATHVQTRVPTRDRQPR